MAFGDLVRNREMGSNTIIKGNIDASVEVLGPQYQCLVFFFFIFYKNSILCGFEIKFTLSSAKCCASIQS